MNLLSKNTSIDAVHENIEHAEKITSEKHTTHLNKRQPLPKNSLPEVMPLDKDMLPTAIRDYIFDVAERQQCPPDFAAITTLCGLSALVGRKAMIYPKQHDDWTVVPNLWGAIIGRPSAMKSPSMKEALKPLTQIESETSKQYNEDNIRYKAELILRDTEKKEIQKQRKEIIKNQTREEALQSIINSEFNNSPPPQRKRLIVNDTSVEKLGELLNENPNGLILVRDELYGWVSKLTKEEFQNERSFYLECFDGNNSYTYDRIGRGTIDIKHCILSVIGGIQPSKINTLVREAMNGRLDDGLIQRFQLAVWPDDRGNWQWIDRTPNTDAKTGYTEVFRKLQELGAIEGNPNYFRFDPKAQKLFVTLVEDLQKQARSYEKHSALESHILKMPKTAASLALLFEIINGGTELVREASMIMAVKWTYYLLSHAERLYGAFHNQGLELARLILKRENQLPSPFSVRDIQRKGWSGLNNIALINEALEYLIDYGHLSIITLTSNETGGRPKISYVWNNANL